MDSDCYSTMYTWFEKCGIISNIRTHLRQNLVNVLKHKDLVLYKSKEARSAKQYVYDMLIAEYLFNHNYSFTLSIFASEVPLLVNFCNNVSQHYDNNDRDGSNRHYKLESDYIAHTLETLGIDPSKPAGKHIISSYVNDKAPLLLSILSSIALFVVNTQSLTKSSLHDKEIQTNLALEENFINAAKLQAMRKKIMHQKQLYDNELKTKETKMRQQASIIKYQLNSLNAKMKKTQDLIQSLTLKEKPLIKGTEKKDSSVQCILEKDVKSSMKQNFLTQETDRLQREQNRKFENDLTKLQRELIKMQEISQDASNQYAQSNVRNIHVQTELESRTIIDEYRILQRDKLELTNLVQEQRLKIKEITLYSIQLSRQLEEARLLQSAQVPVSMARVVHANTIISESSSTEDILQDAKMRLKRLEEESSKADQYFCNFVSTSS